MEDRSTLAASFRGIGADYARYRPGFPDVVVGALMAGVRGGVAGLRALDLGAGTGKLTALLAGAADHVVAVDPSEAMLAVLADTLPGVTALVGSAEAIPVAPASQDLVTVAQALHWFDREAACAEIARVLRPGGGLGLVWNTPDPTCTWDLAAHEVAHPGLSQDGGRQADLPGFDTVDARTIPWREPLARTDYLRRWLTVSRFLSATEPERDRLLRRVEDVLDQDDATAGRETFDLPHVTVVHRYRRADPAP